MNTIISMFFQSEKRILTKNNLMRWAEMTYTQLVEFVGR